MTKPVEPSAPRPFSCIVCGRSPGQYPKLSVTRLNEKGVKGIWRCNECTEQETRKPQ